jgi:chromosome segregation ATPase
MSATPQRTGVMNIVREGDEPEAAVMIPEEVGKAYDVISKYIADPAKLERLISQRDTAKAQLKELKERVEELGEKIEKLDEKIEAVEETQKLLKDLDDVIKAAS